MTTGTSGKITNEPATASNMSNLDPGTALGTHNMKQFLGQFIDDPNQIPGFPTLVLLADGSSTTEEIIHLGQVFEDLYKQHSSILVQTVFELNFSRYVLIFFSVQTQ